MPNLKPPSILHDFDALRACDDEEDLEEIMILCSDGFVSLDQIIILEFSSDLKWL